MLPDLGDVPGLCPCRKFLTPADEDSMFTLDHFPLWYRQAAEHPPGSMVFNLRSAEGPGKPLPELHGQDIPPPPRNTRQPSRPWGPLPTGLHLHPGKVISFPGHQSTMPLKSSARTKERGLTQKSECWIPAQILHKRLLGQLASKNFLFLNL